MNSYFHNSVCVQPIHDVISYIETASVWYKIYCTDLMTCFLFLYAFDAKPKGFKRFQLYHSLGRPFPGPWHQSHALHVCSYKRAGQVRSDQEILFHLEELLARSYFVAPSKEKKIYKIKLRIKVELINIIMQKSV